MEVKKLFDRDSVVRNRKRFDSRHPLSCFFHNQVKHEIKTRINDFFAVSPSMAIVTGFPNLLQKSYPQADLIFDLATLDFPKNQYDLIHHNLSLHLSNDPVGQLIQCRNACKPGGMLLVALFGGQSLVELRTSLISAETRINNGVSPRISPMGDILDLGNLMARTNFKNPISDRLEFKLEYNSMMDLMIHLRSMGEANALMERSKNFTGRGVFKEAEKYYKQKFHLPSGKIFATFELIFLTGWAPKPTG